ncbi:MAG: DUF503 domain-containing protein [Thermoanaerobaculia bacterium]|nr:DUF503 domain-containing protein [Thermoanaerobaculia bacterium]
MVIGVSIFELHLPHSRSLKQKRKVVRGMVDRIHKRFKVSIAETDHHDLHQRAEIGLCLIAQNESEAWRLLDSIRSIVDEPGEGMAIGWQPEILEVA